jgi:hypothetical protein
MISGPGQDSLNRSFSRVAKFAFLLKQPSAQHRDGTVSVGSGGRQIALIN